MRYLLVVALFLYAGLTQAQTVYSQGVYVFPGAPVAISDDVRFIVIYSSGAGELDIQIDSDDSITTQNYTAAAGFPVVAALPLLPDRVLSLTPDAGSIGKFMLLEAPAMPEATPEATPPVTGDGLPVWSINPMQNFVDIDGSIGALNFSASAGDMALFASLAGVFVILLIQFVQWLWSAEE